MSTIDIIAAESVQERIEKQLSYFDHLPNYASRGIRLQKNIGDNVQAFVYRPEGPNGQRVEFFYPGHNTVTNSGEQYYAGKAAGVTTNLNTPDANHNGTVVRMQLSNPATQIVPLKTMDWDDFTSAAIPGSRKAFDSGYPKPNDDDTQNPDRAANTVSYRTTYGLSDFNDTQGGGGGSPVTIKNCAIHDIIGTAQTNDKLLSLGTIAPFPKSAQDTLTFYISHAFVGQ